MSIDIETLERILWKIEKDAYAEEGDPDLGPETAFICRRILKAVQESNATKKNPEVISDTREDKIDDSVPF